MTGGDIVHQYLAEFLQHPLHRFAVVVGFETGAAAEQHQHLGALGQQLVHQFTGAAAAFQRGRGGGAHSRHRVMAGVF